MDPAIVGVWSDERGDGDGRGMVIIGVWSDGRGDGDSRCME